jgi:hypothetical protein
MGLLYILIHKHFQSKHFNLGLFMFLFINKINYFIRNYLS